MRKEPYNGNFDIIKKLNNSNSLKKKYATLLTINKINGLIEAFKNTSDIVTIYKKYYNIINRCYLLKIYYYLKENDLKYIISLNDEEMRLFDDFVNNPYENDDELNSKVIKSIKNQINEYVDKQSKINSSLSKKNKGIKNYADKIKSVKREISSKFDIIKILEKINVF